MSVTVQRSIGNTHACHSWQHANSKQRRKDGSSHGAARYAQALKFLAMDLTQLYTLRVLRYKEVKGGRKKKRNMVQRSIATATAVSLARLAKIETSKGLETAVSLGQRRMA